MTHFVSVQPRALEDIDAIHLWLCQRSLLGAKSWLASLLGALNDLQIHPHSYAAAAESKKFDREVKQCLFKTRHGRRYRILFIIVGSNVQVLRVRRPGQRPVRRADIFD